MEPWERREPLSDDSIIVEDEEFDVTLQKKGDMKRRKYVFLSKKKKSKARKQKVARW